MVYDQFSSPAVVFLVLVSTFAGHDLIMSVILHAVAEKYHALQLRRLHVDFFKQLEAAAQN